MSNKTDFSVKIKLKIKDIEIELDRNEARELKNFLNELFGKEVKYWPHVIETWPYRWRRPYWEYNDEPLWTTRDSTGTAYISEHISCEVS
jgi:hypothetical protein